MGKKQYSIWMKVLVISFIILFSALSAFGVSNDRADENSIINITLITGDTVAAYNNSGKLTYSVLPSSTGITRNYQVIKSPQGTYFIPDDVDLKMVDMELFNIDYLFKEGYNDLSYIPVLITFQSIPDTKISAGRIMGTQGINILSVEHKIGVAAARINKEEKTAFKSLLSNKEVGKIWLDKKRHISLSDSVPLTGAPALWSQGYNGSSIKIAILDTGIDATHPDLNDLDDNAFTNDPKVLVQRDFTDDGNVSDLYGHGTHVASIASGTGEASGGVYKGVAPGAYLWNLKVLNKYGWGYDSWIINATNYAAYGPDGIPRTGDEADIISMSLGGGPTDGDDPLSRAVNNASDAGVVVVIAAGNCGSYFCISTPGAAEKVITVGATDKSDNIAWFSSRGPTLDYRVKPDVAAPGVNIIAARAGGTSMGSVVNSYYTSASGTSMATPHAAGAAALLLQKGVPASWGKPAYVKNVLISAARDLNRSVYEQGGGRIQVLNASRAQIIADPATISFRIVKDVNSSVITFYNLNSSFSRTLNLGVEVRDYSGNIVYAASLNRTTLTIAPNSRSSVLLTINATGVPKSIYSGKITALADNGEEVRAIFGFAKLNELKVNKIKLNGSVAPNEYVWVYKTNITSYTEFYSRFSQTNSSGIASIEVPDGEYNIWSGAFFNDTWIWTTKDKIKVISESSTTLDERLSIPVSFNESKPSQKFAALYSAIAYNESPTPYSSSRFDWTSLLYYPVNTTTRITSTSINLAQSYEYYPSVYYNSSNIWRINTPEWHKLYFSEQGINSPKNYAADYSKLVRRNGEYKAVLINDSAMRAEWAENKSISAPIWWAFGWDMDLPNKRTEYITPDTYYWGILDSWKETEKWWILYDWYVRSYSTGTSAGETWNSQPFTWFHNINRGSNWLNLEGNAFRDGNDHAYESFPIPTNATLYRDNVKLTWYPSTTGYFWYSNYNEPSVANYSLVIEGASNQNLSVRSKTVLNFSYSGTGDYKPPKIYFYARNLDLYNRLQENYAEINLSVIEEKENNFVAGTPDQLSTLSLEYSINDGSGWNAVTLNHMGNGVYTATITGPPNNTFVSLRAKAKDNSGNSASHELIRAFLVINTSEQHGEAKYPIIEEYTITSNMNMTVTNSTSDSKGWILFTKDANGAGLSGWSTSGDTMYHYTNIAAGYLLRFPITSGDIWNVSSNSNGYPFISTTTVQNASDVVATQAGTFRNVVKTRQVITFPNGYDQAAYDNFTERWFAPNVGIIKVKAYSTTGDYYVGQLMRYNVTVTGETDYLPLNIGNRWAFVWNKNGEVFDIISYYRNVGSNPNVVETTDLLKAADDWSRDIAPPGFSTPITTVQLLALADEWSRS